MNLDKRWHYSNAVRIRVALVSYSRDTRLDHPQPSGIGAALLEVAALRYVPDLMVDEIFMMAEHSGTRL